ncbi:hypothetical protein DENIS_3281 [Desulfonema ishimotonii]|uniref:histidine kinase n=1 Tax=Desulfonema ishimotonii TaxID=45657 RepID=A0A401FZ93_9BACT|nr:ATP-binding protein [Desulfonema ishimotonii]GBC62312.1 hypothetical protein DENIS_3281 [Desulfonema ishimotonii]
MTDHFICNACTELEIRIRALENKVSLRKQEKEQIHHLNAVLSSIRDVNRLIIKEKDRQPLIRGICESLVENRGFHNAWIILIDRSHAITASAEAGLGKDFNRILENIRQGDLIRCCHTLLSGTEFLVIDTPPNECADCPVSHMYDGRGAISARLEHEGKIYGVLTVSVPAAFSRSPDEHELFRDVADDIAYALHSIEVEEKRRHTEMELRNARDKLERRVRERTIELEHLSAKLLNAQEEERKRIAGDLHDGIGQCLSAVKFMVETTLEHIDGKVPESDLNPLKALVPLLQEASEEVRSIVMNLRPSILDDLGILATIGWFCRQFQAVYACIEVSQDIGMTEEQVPNALKTIIFRILQEAMNNIAKYSEADHVRLCLRKSGDILELRIEDNGCGFDIAHLLAADSTEKGFGIAGMKERTELSGGVFSLSSAPGRGTTVRAVWTDTSVRPIS